MYDASFCWSAGRWHTEAEYAYKHYTNGSASACHAYNFMADYRMPIDAEWFNQMSFQGRFDGATDHSTGFRTDGLLTVKKTCDRRCDHELSPRKVRTGSQTEL